jgi:choline dehydrogenase-like flavoprotein
VSGWDPTEPDRSTPYPYPALRNEPLVEKLGQRLECQGLHPSALPVAVDIHRTGRCIRCGTCDGFPCKVHAKGDAEVCCILPSLADSNVELIPNTLVRRLVTNESGDRIETAIAEQSGKILQLHATVFVLSCGAVNSAVLLLRSKNQKHPSGLGNSSGLVGRNFMMHNNSAIVAVDIRQKNPTIFQKTIMVNDFYFRGDPEWPFPMGNLQMLGKLQAVMLRGGRHWIPKPLLKAIASRSVDLWATSEDLPDPDNRVLVSKQDQIAVHRTPNNLAAHRRLLKMARRILYRAGFQLVLTQTVGIEANSHQCGTLRFGQNPSDSVLDVFCRSHDVTNMYAVDASFFPSSAAVNPALTIAAQALRVGEHLKKRFSCTVSRSSKNAEQVGEATVPVRSDSRGW